MRRCPWLTQDRVGEIAKSELFGGRLPITQTRGFYSYYISMVRLSGLAGFASRFGRDFSSQLVSLATLERLGQEFLFGIGGPAGILGAVAFGSVSTMLLLYVYPMMKSRVARIALMAFAESTAFGMVVMPIFIPWRAVRFIYGLWSFVAFLSLHSRIVEALQSKVEGDVDTPYSGMIRTFSYNLQLPVKKYIS